MRLWVGLFAFALAGPPARSDEVTRAAEDLAVKYRGQLEELAKWCDERKLTAQAEKTRCWVRPRDPNKLYVAVLPKAVGPVRLPEDAPADVVTWHTEFTRLRRQQAAAWYNLSRKAIRTHRASLAFDLVLAAIREDPDHEACRRLLGYQDYRGQWCSQEEVARLRSGQVWHEKFGWLSKAFVSRYENGQRYFNGRWMGAEEEARLRRDIANGWEVETDHYTIRTNHSLEAGVALGKKLERLYGVWKQLFVRYYTTEAQVAALFEGRPRGRPVNLPRHQVVFFRDRDDYNQALRSLVPNIGISIGMYLDATRRAYFFAAEPGDDRTLYHEATHQLFHESRPVSPHVARQAHFWIVEGIALYMESLHEEDGFYVLGGWDDVRLHAARVRLLRDKFYVPLAEFTTYGMQQIQADPRIATLYSQAAGLTHFLIHYDGGRYRDALVQYLSLVYADQADATTLPRLAGASYAELDAQYRAFLDRGS